MRISTRARYALRLMIDIARHSGGERPVHLRQIAEWNDLSHGYLEQLMISLRNASLVRGLSGRKGGYILARPAEKIKLTEIVEAVIGPINLAECVLHPDNCPRSPICESRPIWVMLNVQIKNTLDRFTLADIADDKWLQKANKELVSIGGLLPKRKKGSRVRRTTAADRKSGGAYSLPCGSSKRNFRVEGKTIDLPSFAAPRNARKPGGII